ncbi:MAG: bifunctional DNA-binding transcriptional regulator/O6-methylguanine-DNA methyltransferase Ada [Burkholderiaceae bacterium]|nr:bifunctional DNA-binding transcriptional regulator/O6-methylguanine-DNA methyltransferase Ada [Burkholderiaceae bacterium]
MSSRPQRPSSTARDASQDPRWAAVLARDPAADGRFVYGVRTTGVYARPSSAARLPRPENVDFFESAQAAEAAGYRASRRAGADRSVVAARRTDLVASICRLIERTETAPSLHELAAQVGMSPYHLHRIFKGVTGLTPRAYAVAQRARRMRTALTFGQGTITDAIYQAGFNSSSRFYESSDRVLGMRPTNYRAGGGRETIAFALGQCSLGAILVAQSGRGVCAIMLGDDPDALLRALQDQVPKAELIGGDGDFEQLVAQVIGFVEAPHIGLDLPLDVRGTAFQERVWQALQEIPPGNTATYTDIAQRIGHPAAIRAVAQACAANRLAVAIPCHRVIRRDGDLAGYRWGVVRKRDLQAREQAAHAAIVGRTSRSGGS